MNVELLQQVKAHILAEPGYVNWREVLACGGFLCAFAVSALTVAAFVGGGLFFDSHRYSFALLCWAGAIAGFVAVHIITSWSVDCLDYERRLTLRCQYCLYTGSKVTDGRQLMNAEECRP